MSRTVLHLHARVKEGHRIDFCAPTLNVGDEVDVVVLAPEASPPSGAGKSALEIIKELPPCQLFKSAAEVDAFLAQERDAWDR